MRTLALLLITLPALSGCASLLGPPALSTNLVGSTHYMFRGVPQNEKGVLQVDSTVGLSTPGGAVLSGTVWANMGLRSDTGAAVFPDGNGGEFDEVDLVLDYARNFGSVAASFGVLNYTFPNVVGVSTTEIYAGASLTEVFLAPSLSLYYDVDEIEGVYLSGGVSHGWDLNEKLTACLGLSLGYADDDQAMVYFAGASSGGLADVAATGSCCYAYSENTSLTLTLTGSSIVDSDLENALTAANFETENLWLSLGLSWSR